MAHLPPVKQPGARGDRPLLRASTGTRCLSSTSPLLRVMTENTSRITYTARDYATEQPPAIGSRPEIGRLSGRDCWNVPASAGMHEQYRARRVAYDVIGDTPQHGATDTAPAMGRHRYQIGVLPPGDPHDRLRRCPFRFAV